MKNIFATFLITGLFFISVASVHAVEVQGVTPYGITMRVNPQVDGVACGGDLFAIGINVVTPFGGVQSPDFTIDNSANGVWFTLPFPYGSYVDGSTVNIYGNTDPNNCSLYTTSIVVGGGGDIFGNTAISWKDGILNMLRTNVPTAIIGLTSVILLFAGIKWFRAIFHI